MNHTLAQREAHLRLVLKRKHDIERQRVLDEAERFAREVSEVLG